MCIIVSKGLAPSAPPDFVPILKQSVCYVVMAVIINEKNEILMMQEAKSSCAGQWYLPAGRVEPNESIMVILNMELKIIVTYTRIILSTGCIQTRSFGGNWFDS